MTRELRAGSFKSLQELGDQYSDSNYENSLYGEAKNLKYNNPNDKSRRNEFKYMAKSSHITDGFNPTIRERTSMSNNESPARKSNFY